LEAKNEYAITKVRTREVEPRSASNNLVCPHYKMLGGRVPYDMSDPSHPYERHCVTIFSRTPQPDSEPDSAEICMLRCTCRPRLKLGGRATKIKGRGIKNSDTGSRTPVCLQQSPYSSVCWDAVYHTPCPTVSIPSKCIRISVFCKGDAAQKPH
jgi:hypothetical protein